jgi:Leucine-rich repeat (LRR) protein
MADPQPNNMRNVAFVDDLDQPPLPPTAAAREGGGNKGLFQTRNLLIVTLILLAGAIGLAAYFGVMSSQGSNDPRSTDGADTTPGNPLYPDSNGSTSTVNQTSPCCSFDNETCVYDCDQYECGKPSSSKCSAGTVIYTSVGSVGGVNGTDLDGILVDMFASLFPTDPTTGSGIISDIDFLRWLNQSSLTKDYFGNSRTKFGLVNLYYSTNGREWTANNNWLSPSSFCIWYGVTCDSSGTAVTYVDLPNNNLVGTIARDFMLLLGEQGLVSLDLGLNKLYGSIPPEGLRTLTRLQSLSLYNNSLTGGIPSEIESLVDLQLLFMGNNELKGTIPLTIGKLESLQKLDLHNNQMTGSLPLSIGLLQSLTQLYLSSNSFNSFLPTEIGALKSLQERT